MADPRALRRRGRGGASRSADGPRRCRRPGGPRRLVRVRRSLAIHRERRADGWSLHFTGPDATGPLMDDVMDHVEQAFGRDD